MHVLCYKVEMKMTVSGRCFYLKYYISKFIVLLLPMEKTQKNKNILPPFLRNNKVVQVQEVTFMAHINIFATNFIFTMRRTHMAQETFSLGNV